MTFWEIFVRVLPRRPLAALLALWWHLTGRRLRARNRLRSAGARLSFAYDFWQQKIESKIESLPTSVGSSARRARLPVFSILLIADRDQPDAVARSISSFERQTYAPCSVIRPEPASVGGTARALENALENEGTDFLIPVRAGTELSSSAVHHFADAVIRHPDAVIVYGDQDEIDANGRRSRPWFKPGWNEELFLAQDYLSDAVAINVRAARRALARSALADGSFVYEMLLRLIKLSAGPIIHVPRIIAHIGQRCSSSEQDDRVELVAKHVAPSGATAIAGPFGTVNVLWPLPKERPLVSIIIPTKDKVELLRACVDTLVEKTSYEPFEILIIDNNSVQKTTLEYLSNISADRRVRVIPYAGAYNFSAINNFAAMQAAGQYLCLLNNDTEIVEPEWLTELMRYALRSDIGAAGAKLLYADGRIQHAGVIVGIGDAAGHAHRNQPANDEGYFAQAHSAHFVSAVTGACLVVDKRKFTAVGGLDEQFLAVAYNDVDLCLKLERAGWRNVYVPRAVLIHHESKSRGKDHSPSQIDRYRRELKTFQDRWDVANYVDPLFNPNLDRSSETFIIRL